jgi:hypothetical protein
MEAISGFLLLSCLFVALALVQQLCWLRWPQSILNHTRGGRALLSVLPWRPRVDGGAYGRATAREPMVALTCAGLLTVFACVSFAAHQPGARASRISKPRSSSACCLGRQGGLLSWAGLRPSAAYEPWAYLDARYSPVARRAAHTRAAFGPPSDVLSVLATACDERRSVCDGSLLQPLSALCPEPNPQPNPKP